MYILVIPWTWLNPLAHTKVTQRFTGRCLNYLHLFLKVLFLATGQKFRPNTDKSHKLRTICCHISTWVYERQLGIFIRTNISERIAQLFPTNIEDNLKGALDQTNTQETTCRWFINNTHTHTHTHTYIYARTHAHAHAHTHTAEVSDSDVDSFQCLMN